MQKLSHQNGIQLKELAQQVNGKVVGKDRSIYGICSLNDPKPKHLSMLLKRELASSLKSFQSETIVALLVSKDVLDKLPSSITEKISLIVVQNPQKDIIKLLPNFYKPYQLEPGISPKAEIHPTASVSDSASIGAFCSVGMQSIIGDNVTLHPHVTIYPGVEIGAGSVIHSGAVIREDCKIGPHSVIQNGAVIGADGFGYIVDEEKGLVSFPQVGTVQSGPMVDVGANACVDRGALGDTSLGAQTKIDNLVQVGHNTQIGQGSILCGQVGVSGSCKIGNGVVLGGNTGLADHVSIADGCRFGARSGIARDVSEKGDYVGRPLMLRNQWIRVQKILERLPELDKKVKHLWKNQEKQ